MSFFRGLSSSSLVEEGHIGMAALAKREIRAVVFFAASAF